MPAYDRSHYSGTFQKDARRVRKAAYDDPSTKCPTCGLTLEQAQVGARTPVTWDAGHMLDGVKGSPLIAQHSSCNRSAGARAGNAKRGSGYDW